MSDAHVSGFRPTLIAGCLGVFVAQVAYSLPASLLGTIQQDLGISGAQLTWVSAVFATAMVIFELTFGVVGDMFGRKQLLLGGLGVLVVGELITLLGSSDVHVLWAGQAIAGIGAGALYPISLTMIAALAPDPVVRARSIALWAGFLSIGAAVSPITAGAIAEAGHWTASFWIPIGLAAVAFVVALRATNSSAPEGRRLDLPGQLTLVLGLLALVWALTQGSQDGYGQRNIIVGFVLAVIFLVAFVAIEVKATSPLIHLRLFANRAFAITGVVAVIGMFAYLGVCFSMTMFLGAVIHIGAVYIGILFLVIQIPALLLVPVVARLIHSVSPRWVLTLGFVCIAAAAFWASRFDAHSFLDAHGAPHDAAFVKFIAPMVLNGIGFALTVGSITAVAINSVPLRLAGMASATTNLLRDFGFALGPVLCGAIYNRIANARFDDGLSGAIGAAIKSGAVPADKAAQGPFVGTIEGIGHSGGAVAVNSMPVVPGLPGKPPLGAMPAEVHELAFSALSHAFSVTFLVASLCALAAAVLTGIGLAGAKSASEVSRMVEPEALVDAGGVTGDPSMA